MASNRKRRATASPSSPGAHFERNGDQNDANSDTDGDPEQSRRTTTSKRVKQATLSHVIVSGPSYPRSVYEGYVPPFAAVSDASALQTLGSIFSQIYSGRVKPEYTYFQLDDFSVYRPKCLRHTHELAALDCLQVRNGVNELVFDGVLSFGNKRLYVQGVHFKTLTVDGYGDSRLARNARRLCIQSEQARAHSVWYRLGRPSSVYRRFYEPFQWLSEFTLHFVNYLLVTDDVTLADFRSNFFSWLDARYAGQEQYEHWRSECNRLCDFRTTVVANIGFLRKECHGIDDAETGLCQHPLWDATLPQELQGIEERPAIELNTVVTPFVYKCFKEMYFHRHLEPRQIYSQVVLSQVTALKERLGLTPFGASPLERTNMLTPPSLEDSGDPAVLITAGDVVSINRELGGKWKSGSLLWYAYVQAVRLQDASTVLDVIWLYDPKDTTLGSAHYPFDNELFISDHCDCGVNAIPLASVVDKVPISWFVQDPSSVDGFCVRQKYRTIHDDDTYDFISLSRSDFNCGCNDIASDFEECRRTYQVGETVLVRVRDTISRQDVLEPAQIINFDLDNKNVLLRRLSRKIPTGQTRPNELILTNEEYSRPPNNVIRKIHVRFFRPETVAQNLPHPYSRNGVGDFYFISRGGPDSADDDDKLHGIDANSDVEKTGTRRSILPALKQGLSPIDLVSSQKLRGMGIFCGGGNFDRGLSEGGSIDFQYAVDFDRQAIHSYGANMKEDDKTNLFFGSVNDYLAQALRGSRDEAIAQPGDIKVCIGGSPCPGFSNMQNDKQSERSLRNCSLVASFVSFVDFFCPGYCVLENVVSMTQGHGPQKSENVFAQILAALVGMGYQVQQFLMDAWSYGSSQARTRVFIVASAPGLEPVRRPPHSHGHPTSKLFQTKSLGRSSNGLPFGQRRDEYTPFTHVSASTATADLPDIGESLTQLCPAFPDHRESAVGSTEARGRYAAMPIYPVGMGLVKTAKKGLLRGAPLHYYNINKERNQKAYTRVDPDGLFPTVTTKLHPRCRNVGTCLHWSQDRTISVMEMRRAQGFLDHEVIIGSTSDQLRIIGNSVERNVAFVLGLALRESWETSTEAVRKRVQGSDGGYDGDDDDEAPAKDDRTVQLLTPRDSEDHESAAEIQATPSIEEEVDLLRTAFTEEIRAGLSKIA